MLFIATLLVFTHVQRVVASNTTSVELGLRLPSTGNLFRRQIINCGGCFQEIVVIQLMTVVKVISNAPFYVNLVTATAVLLVSRFSTVCSESELNAAGHIIATPTTTYVPPPPPPTPTYVPPPPPTPTYVPPPPPPPTPTYVPPPPPPPTPTYVPPPPPPPTPTYVPPPPPSTAVPVPPPTGTQPLPPPSTVLPPLSTPVTLPQSSETPTTLSTVQTIATAPSSLPASSLSTPGPENKSRTLAVKSCGGASAISVSNFAIAYDRFNHSVEFSMIAHANQDKIYPTMNIELQSFGSKMPTQAVNLCKFFTCPLSYKDMTIQGNQILDQSYHLSSAFWNFPSDSTVKLMFVGGSNGTQLGCLTTKLYNGVTVQHTAISWATGVITVALGLVVGVLGAAGGANIANAGTAGGPASQGTTAVTTTTPAGHSSPPAGHMDPITLFLHFQFISSSGLLSISYPTVYHSFTTNFAWANFILPIGAFRKAAVHLRKCTLRNSDTSVVSTHVPSGISTYSSKLGINAQDLFSIVYLVFLCACAILLGLYLIAGAVTHIAIWRAPNEETKEVWEVRKIRFAHMSSNNSFRLVMLALGTLATFAFYQWTQACTSGLMLFLSASIFIFALLMLAGASFLILFISKKPGGLEQLFSKDHSYARRWGSMYNTLNKGQLYFAVALWVTVLIRSAITAFGQSNGLAQVIAMIILEFVVCVSIFRYQPYYSRGYNRVNYLIQGTRLVSNVVLLVFVDTFNINPTVTTILGLALLIINSFVALVLVVLMILKMGWGKLWFRGKLKHAAFEKKMEGLQDPVYDEVAEETTGDEEYNIGQ